jgi:hypothetical protein
MKERNHLENLYMDGKVLKLILNRMGGCGLDSFGFGQTRGRLLYMVKNPQVPQSAGSCFE